MLLFYKRVLKGVTCTLMWRNTDFLLSYIFLEYLIHKLEKLVTDQRLKCVGIGPVILETLLSMYVPKEILLNEYIDTNSCMFVDLSMYKTLLSTWYYVCTKNSKKYKLKILPVTKFDFFSKDTILVSETVYHNLQNACPFKESFLLRKYK